MARLIASLVATVLFVAGLLGVNKPGRIGIFKKLMMNAYNELLGTKLKTC